jgi:hypothetical protein
MMAPGQDNTVRAQLMLIDLSTNAEDRTLRLDIDNSDSPSAIAFSPNWATTPSSRCRATRRSRWLDVLDFLRQDSPGTVDSRWGSGWRRKR